MSTPHWLRVERQKRAEAQRHPAQTYYLPASVRDANLKALDDEMAEWSRRQIWTTGDAR